MAKHEIVELHGDIIWYQCTVCKACVSQRTMLDNDCWGLGYPNGQPVVVDHRNGELIQLNENPCEPAKRELRITIYTCLIGECDTPIMEKFLFCMRHWLMLDGDDQIAVEQAKFDADELGIPLGASVFKPVFDKACMKIREVEKDR